MKEREPATERTWMRLGATREQAKRLLAIRRVTLTDDDRRVLLKAHRGSNIWVCAIDWLDAGARVWSDGDLFYRDVDPPEVAAAVRRPLENPS